MKRQNWYQRISFFILIFSLVAPLTGYATPLTEAVEKGSIGAITKLLDKGVDINEQDEDYRWTALMHASFYGDIKIVRLLIDRGADVNKQVPEYGFTALMKAAEEGNNEVVKLLIEKGAIIDMQSMGGKTALAFAASDNELETVKLLLDKGADIDVAIAYLEKASKIKKAAAGLQMLRGMKK